MQCKTCQTSLPSDSRLTVCPVCGESLQPENVRPSFERVWADLQAEQLKKKPDPGTFQQAWNWYLQALQSRPDEAVFAAQFIRDWPQYAAGLSLPSWIPGGSYAPADQRILLWGAAESSVAALQLAWQDSLQRNILEDLVKSLEEQPACELLEPLRLRLEGRWQPARQSLRALLRMQPDQPLVFGLAKAEQAFTGLSMESVQRIRQMEQAAQAEDLDFLLEALYRPLDEEENPFAHLCSLPVGLADCLRRNAAVWKRKTEDLLNTDQALRGIHLALQTLKNQAPDLAGICEELLTLQYEKAYLRPFSEIEATDHSWL